MDLTGYKRKPTNQFLGMDISENNSISNHPKEMNGY